MNKEVKKEFETPRSLLDKKINLLVKILFEKGVLDEKDVEKIMVR